MSNARSPREVCSTTIGTSGLTGPRLFRVVRSVPSDPSGAGVTPTPPNSGASLATGIGRQSGLLEPAGLRVRGRFGGGRHGLRRVHHDAQPLRVRDVLAQGVEAARRADPVQQLLR